MLLLAQNGTTIVNLDYVARIDIVSAGGGRSELKALIVDAPDVILFSGEDETTKIALRLLLDGYDKQGGVGFINFQEFSRVMCG